MNRSEVLSQRWDELWRWHEAAMNSSLNEGVQWIKSWLHLPGSEEENHKNFHHEFRVNFVICSAPLLYLCLAYQALQNGAARKFHFTESRIRDNANSDHNSIDDVDAHRKHNNDDDFTFFHRRKSWKCRAENRFSTMLANEARESETLKVHDGNFLIFSSLLVCETKSSTHVLISSARGKTTCVSQTKTNN